MFIPLRDGFKKNEVNEVSCRVFWPDPVVFLIISVELFPFQCEILSFCTAILQPEISFVKHFFQLFFVTWDKPLCVSEKKIRQFLKISVLSGIFPLKTDIFCFNCYSSVPSKTIRLNCFSSKTRLATSKMSSALTASTLRMMSSMYSIGSPMRRERVALSSSFIPLS